MEFTAIVFYVQVSKDEIKWSYAPKSPYFMSKMEAMRSRAWRNACDYSPYFRIIEREIVITEGMKGWNELYQATKTA